MGRVGFNLGREIGNQANIYVKANLLHEFGGGYDVTMADSGGNRFKAADDFNDTWFEYGIGAALKTGSNSHIYIDVERSSGSDFKKDWQWNAGARWTFLKIVVKKIIESVYPVVDIRSLFLASMLKFII